MDRKSLQPLYYLVVHPVEDVRDRRNHGRLEQPDVVIEEAHVPGIETDRSAVEHHRDLEKISLKLYFVKFAKYMMTNLDLVIDIAP